MIKCNEGACILSGNAHTLLAELAVIVRAMTLSLGKEFGDDEPENTMAKTCAMGIASAVSETENELEMHVGMNEKELEAAWEAVKAKRKENTDG